MWPRFFNTGLVTRHTGWVGTVRATKVILLLFLEQFREEIRSVKKGISVLAYEVSRVLLSFCILVDLHKKKVVRLQKSRRFFVRFTQFIISHVVRRI